MTAAPVVVTSGLTHTVTTGGTPVNVVAANPFGAIITNPYLAADQGISDSEYLLLDTVGVGPLSALKAYRTVISLNPGDTWVIYPGQTNGVTVNAVTSGHRFSVVVFFTGVVPPAPPSEGILNFSFPNDSALWPALF